MASSTTRRRDRNTAPSYISGGGWSKHVRAHSVHKRVMYNPEMPIFIAVAMARSGNMHRSEHTINNRHDGIGWTSLAWLGVAWTSKNSTQLAGTQPPPQIKTSSRETKTPLHSTSLPVLAISDQPERTSTYASRLPALRSKAASSRLSH